MSNTNDRRNVISEFLQRAKQRTLPVVLPEGSDSRIVLAARRLRDEAIAEPIVLGSPTEINTAAQRAGVDLAGIRTIDPQHP